MVSNVNRTTKSQWKLDTIKNCKYLQCGQNSARSIGFVVEKKSLLNLYYENSLGVVKNSARIIGSGFGKKCLLSHLTTRCLKKTEISI